MVNPHIPAQAQDCTYCSWNNNFS